MPVVNVRGATVAVVSVVPSRLVRTTFGASQSAFDLRHGQRRLLQLPRHMWLCGDSSSHRQNREPVRRGAGNCGGLSRREEFRRTCRVPESHRFAGGSSSDVAPLYDGNRYSAAAKKVSRAGADDPAAADQLRASFLTCSTLVNSLRKTVTQAYDSLAHLLVPSTAVRCDWGRLVEVRREPSRPELQKGRLKSSC